MAHLMREVSNANRALDYTSFIKHIAMIESDLNAMAMDIKKLNSSMEIMFEKLNDISNQQKGGPK